MGVIILWDFFAIKTNKAMSSDFGLGPGQFIVAIITNSVFKVCGIENESEFVALMLSL